MKSLPAPIAVAQHDENGGELVRQRLAALPLFDIALGVAVGMFGVTRAVTVGTSNPAASLLIAIGMGVAAGLYRRAPAIALSLVWLTALLQVLAELDIALVQLAAVVVAYGTSRYGRPATVIASVISIPLGGIAAVLYSAFIGLNIVQESGLWQLLSLLTAATNLGYYDFSTGLVVGFIVVTALLAAPWGLGLLVRLREQSRQSAAQRRAAEAEAARATQLAELRTAQATLARDVHDVVGHSLAVIIAQADSIEAMPDSDLARVRAAVANIGETARRSLGDVRAVLTDDPGSASSARGSDGLENLVEGVRAGGTDVTLEVTGTPRPLPPELDVAAYRALQEMLTNVLKHGVTGGPVSVELEWGEDEVRMTTTNEIADPPGPGGRQGLDGLRERLASVGGTLDAHAAGSTWTTQVRLPVRPAGGAL